MAAAQIIGLRFSEYVSSGDLGGIAAFLDDDVVVSTWNGVAYGKDRAMTMFEDHRRFMHHKQNFNRWRQVQHCLDPTLATFAEDTEGSSVAEEDKLERSQRLVTGRAPSGVREVEKYFDGNGYDSQGYAMFEREGTIANHPRFAFRNKKVREVIVVHKGLVVLYQIGARR